MNKGGLELNTLDKMDFVINEDGIPLSQVDSKESEEGVSHQIIAELMIFANCDVAQIAQKIFDLWPSCAIHNSPIDLKS